MSAGRQEAYISAAAQSLSSHRRMLLLAPLTPNDVPAALIRRLRAAIALGLLPEGERLPKEADLATQMAVTTFSLREALSELRRQGLVVTRVGKYGGTFVVAGAGHQEVTRAELLSVSSAELRDLADWRRMLSSHAAELAADAFDDGIAPLDREEAGKLHIHIGRQHRFEARPIAVVAGAAKPA